MKCEESRIAEAINVLTTRLEAWNVPDATTKATEYVRDMVRNGWRPRALPVPARTPDTGRPELRVLPTEVPAYQEAKAAIVTPLRTADDRAGFVPESAKPEPEES